MMSNRHRRLWWRRMVEPGVGDEIRAREPGLFEKREALLDGANTGRAGDGVGAISAAGESRG